MPRIEPIFELFRRHREERGDEPAFLITSGDRSVPITWRQFTDDVERVAFGVAKFIPGGTVGLFGENSYEWLVAHAGVMFAGGVVVPIDPNLNPDEIADRLAFTGAKALIHSALYAARARDVARRLPGLVVAGFGSRDADRFLSSADRAFAAGEPGCFSLPPPDDKRVSTIVFTSGTTSRPHGVELSMEGIAAFGSFGRAQLRVRPGTRSLLVLPLHHIFGVSSAYLMLGAGTSLGVCPDFRRLYDAVERFRAQFIFLVPALAEILAAKIAQHAVSAEAALGFRIEWILVGGAPMSRRIHDALLKLGIAPLAGYGLTETSALYSLDPVGSHRIGAAGQAAADGVAVEVKVSDRGTLMIRGPNVFKGYYREPERTAAVLKDGWFDTGDVGRVDGDGYVWITGRASRTIVLSSGKKIAPEELEEKLLAIPGFREAVVSGDGDSREVRAEIYAVIPEEAVHRHVARLNRSLPVYQRIKTVVVRGEPFPRTASGKIRLGPAPAPAAGPRRRHHARRLRLSLFIMQVAVMVLVLNIVPILLAQSGIKLPLAIDKAISFIGECGEIVLALFAIVAYIISRKVFPSEE